MNITKNTCVLFLCFPHCGRMTDSQYLHGDKISARDLVSICDIHQCILLTFDKF